MKKILFLLGLLLAIVGGLFLFQNYIQSGSFSFLKASPKAVISNQTFNITIAKEDKEKQIGLSDKESLDQNAGMLFVFDSKDYHQFWMKEMKFPIDIIYIQDNKIITIYKNAQPASSSEGSTQIYKPEEPVDKVLEINAGLSQKYGFKKGTEVKFENL